MLDILTQYEIPYWHPLLVHFPVALLSTAALMLLVWVVTDKDHWLQIYAGFQLFGSIGSVFAYRSGRAIEEDTAGVPIVDELVGDHELYAKITLVLALVTSVVLLIMLLKRRSATSKKVSWPAKTALLLLTVATAVFLVATAHLGGVMVWGIPAS